MRSLKKRNSKGTRKSICTKTGATVPQTPTSVVRRSTKLSRPHEQYSPSLYYLLLSDSGEPECYEETMQVDTKKKREKGMKEEMNSLVNNQTWYLVQLPRKNSITE